jgi:hypothetical protein
MKWAHEWQDLAHAWKTIGPFIKNKLEWAVLLVFLRDYWTWGAATLSFAGVGALLFFKLRKPKSTEPSKSTEG